MFNFVIGKSVGALCMLTKHSRFVLSQYVIIILFFKCLLIPEGLISPLFACLLRVTISRPILEALLLNSAVLFLPASLVVPSD